MPGSTRRCCPNGRRSHHPRRSPHHPTPLPLRAGIRRLTTTRVANPKTPTGTGGTTTEAATVTGGATARPTTTGITRNGIAIEGTGITTITEITTAIVGTVMKPPIATVMGGIVARTAATTGEVTAIEMDVTLKTTKNGTRMKTVAERKRRSAMTLVDRKRVWVTTLAVVMAMTLPGVALAHDSDEKDPEATTAEAETSQELSSVLATLPVLGSGLNVTITRDEKGEIASVALDPSDGATQVKDGDHRVVFVLGEDGPRVIVKSAKGIVSTKVKADDPADAAGDGVWSGDVFGNGVITIPYNVSFDGITPTITVGTITAPDGVTATVGEPRTKTSDDGDRAVYKVKVVLESGDDDAVVKLYAKTKVNDEGETRVSVSATLLSKDRAKWWWGKDRDHDRDRDHKWDRDNDKRDRDHKWDRDDDRDRNHDRDGDRDRDRDRDHDRDRGDGDRDRDRGGDRDRDRGGDRDRDRGDRGGDDN